MRPTWAEVSLSNLRYNFGVVQRHIGVDVTICAVVKADGYGHGAVECARALEEEGAQWLGVTSLDEAIPLRDAGIQGRILLMTGFWRGEEEEIVRLGLTPTVWEPGQVESLERAAARFGQRHSVHLKVDTGMGRLGVAPEDLPQVCAALKQASHLVPEGLSTHLASKALPELNGKPASARRKPGANLPAPHQAAPCPNPLSSGLNAFAQIARQPFPGSRLVRVPTRSE